ncbi:unnamed protein product, partial [Prorocentrum cordatum]
MVDGRPRRGAVWGAGRLRGLAAAGGSPPAALPEARLEGPWLDLEVPPCELRPEFSLVPGQSFGWKRVAADRWLGVLGSGVVLIRQSAETTLTSTL